MIDAVLKEFLEQIKPVRSQIQGLTLFGSRARGDHRSDSDYDLLVLVEKKEDHLIDSLYEAVMNVLLSHSRLISLKVFEEKEFARLQALHTPFVERVINEGVPIG